MKYIKTLLNYLPVIYPIFISSFFIPGSEFSPSSNTMVLVSLISVLISIHIYLHYKNSEHKNSKVNILYIATLLIGVILSVVVLLNMSSKSLSFALFGKGVSEWSMLSVFFLCMTFILYFNTAGVIRKLSFLSSSLVVLYTVFNFLGSKYFPGVGQYTGYMNIPMFSFAKLFNYPFVISLVAFAGTSLAFLFEKYNVKLKTFRFPVKQISLIVLVLSVIWFEQYARRTIAAHYFNSSVSYITNSDVQNANRSLDKAIFISPLDRYYLGKIELINIQISQLTQNMTDAQVASSSDYKDLVEGQIKNAELAVDYDNTEPANYYALGQAYQKSAIYQKDIGYSKAIATYNELEKMVPDKDSIETLKANTAFSVGETSAGLDYLNRALTINASSTSALYTYSQYYSSIKDTKKATQYAERAVLTRPDMFDAHANLAVMYMYENRYKDASIQWYTALQISQNNPTAIYYLAYSLINAKLYDDAQKVIDIFQKSTTDTVSLKFLNDTLSAAKNANKK